VHHSWSQLLTCILPNSESLTIFSCCGISPSGDTLNESSLLIPRAFGWLQSYTAPTAEIPVQSTVHHSWSQLLTCIPSNIYSSFGNRSFVVLSPWAIVTKSETYWQEFTAIKSCLNFDRPLELQSYAFWLWNQLKSSLLLELYARLFLTLFENFDMVLQHDISAIKVLEVSLKLKQNLFRKHDYAAFMKQVNGASSVIISPAQLTCNLFIYHIGAFKLIEKYLVISKDLIIQYFYSMLKNKKSEHDIDNVSVKSIKIVGGGISKLFTVEELQPFMNVIDAHKFKFISYSTPSEAAALQSLNNTLVLGNIPLSTLTSKLGITELKVIAKCHKVTVHSKI
jgi:hypothetical protein